MKKRIYPDSSIIDRKFLARFFSKVKVSDVSFYNGSACWEWTGCGNGGYSSITSKSDTYYAHRLAYCVFVESVHPDLDCDHLCQNKRCVNPAHLEVVHPRINILRSNNRSAINARKTHCFQGHPLTGDNLLSYPLRHGFRNCRECAKLRLRLKHRPPSTPEERAKRRERYHAKLQDPERRKEFQEQCRIRHQKKKFQQQLHSSS